MQNASKIPNSQKNCGGAEMKRNKIIGASVVCLVILAGIRTVIFDADRTRQSTDPGSGTAVVSQSEIPDTQEDPKQDDQPNAETADSTQTHSDSSTMTKSNSSTVKKDPHEWEDPERPIQSNSSAGNSDSNVPDSGSDTSDTPNDSGGSKEENPSNSGAVTPPKDPNDLSVTGDNQGGFGKLQ